MSLVDPVSTVKDYILGSIILVLLVAVGILAFMHEHDKALIAQDKTEIVQYQTANQAWVEDAGKQNKAIADLKAAADANADMAAKAQKLAQDEAATHDATANRLEAFKVTGDDCAGAKQLAETYFKGKP